MGSRPPRSDWLPAAHGLPPGAYTHSCTSGGHSHRLFACPCTHTRPPVAPGKKSKPNFRPETFLLQATPLPFIQFYYRWVQVPAEQAVQVGPTKPNLRVVREVERRVVTTIPL